MPVRVNTRISDKANEWLDKKSAEMAISKSALINMAIENFIKEMEVVHTLPSLLEELKKLGVKVEQNPASEGLAKRTLDAE